MIRLATAEDIPQINVLRREVNDIHVQGKPEFFKPGFCRELQEHVNVYLESENNYVAVEDRDGVITGMVMVDYIDKPENPYSFERRFVHIAEVCVLSSCRRQGVAHRLFKFVRRDALEKGYGRIELDVWAFNDALAFYEAEGFTVFRRFLELDLNKGGRQP